MEEYRIERSKEGKTYKYKLVYVLSDFNFDNPTSEQIENLNIKETYIRYQTPTFGMNYGGFVDREGQKIDGSIFFFKEEAFNAVEFYVDRLETEVRKLQTTVDKYYALKSNYLQEEESSI